MQTAQLVLDYLRVLLWPLLIVALALGFRGRIRTLLENLASRARSVTELSGMGLTAKFSEVEARTEVAAGLIEEAAEQARTAGQIDSAEGATQVDTDESAEALFLTHSKEDRDKAREAIAMRLLGDRGLPPPSPTRGQLVESAIRARTTGEVQEGLNFAVTLVERYFRLLASDVYALDVAKLRPGLRNTIQAIARSPLAAMQWESLAASAIAIEGVVRAVGELTDITPGQAHEAAYQAIQLLSQLSLTADRLAALTVAEVKRWISRRPDMQVLFDALERRGESGIIEDRP